MTRVVIILSLLVLGLILWPLQHSDRRGGLTKETIVTAYLDALRVGDEHAISRLIPETHSADQEIRDRVAKYGNRNFRIEEIVYEPRANPRFLSVTIELVVASTDRESHVTEEIAIKQVKDRWYLILGRDSNGLPLDVPTTQPN